MADYISREAFVESQRHLYCDNCAKRKGTKNGKVKFVYEIGDAPCRACGYGDVIDAAEDYPAANVVPVKRGEWEEVSVTYDTIEVEAVASMRCDKCKRYHNVVFFYGNPKEEAHYCPNCGASMTDADS